MPSDDAWRGSYDAWKLATPPEYEVDPEDEIAERTELAEAYDRIADLGDELKHLRALYEAAIKDNDEAIEWAREYERVHGPFKSRPSFPVFMITF